MKTLKFTKKLIVKNPSDKTKVTFEPVLNKKGKVDRVQVGLTRYDIKNANVLLTAYLDRGWEIL